MLAKVEDSITYPRLSSYSELFLPDVLKKVVERSSKALHGEAICKAIVQEKPQLKGKKFHFSLQAHQQKKVFLLQASLARFQDVATSFLLLPCPQHACGSSFWATWLRWSAFFLKVAPTYIFCSGTSRTTGPPWWTTWPFKSLCRRDAWRQFVGSSTWTGGCLASLSRFLLRPCCCILTHLCWVGEPTCCI